MQDINRFYVKARMSCWNANSFHSMMENRCLSKKEELDHDSSKSESTSQVIGGKAQRLGKE
jgi:hypothetical protein